MTMENPTYRPMMPRFPAHPQHYFPPHPPHPRFFPPGWFSPYGQMMALPPPPPGYGLRGAPPPPTPTQPLQITENGEPAEDSASTPSSGALVLARRTPTRRDTPLSYPTPPVDDPDNPPVPIHPYLFHDRDASGDNSPVIWDVRSNLMHSARRRATGERLSSIALKANAINAGGLNHTRMRIICSDENFPWPIVISRDNGICVGDVLGEIGAGLNKEVTMEEQWIAREERVARADASKQVNIADGTGAFVGKKRTKADVMRRVDWLGENTRFKGLVHGSAKEYETLVRKRTHTHDRPNTWVLVVESRLPPPPPPEAEEPTPAPDSDS